ncbi:gliding motility lipoprotein GldH [Dysgonomonas termitidis]|jgi:gliding motility-associated lipoprotein GldH|uniref:Gliding motility lipoprotein GldH n=1 Tax=Dysgonomonas termitidis TaxID=1516126 RepID=A0ABV9KZM2_9BACT
MGSPTKKSLTHKSLSALCGILLTIIAVSCNKQEIYYRFHEIKDAEWAQNDKLIFNIDSTVFELNVPYTISFEVTNNVNYPYQNIWFFVQTDIYNDSLYTKREKEYLLADKLGKWAGSGFGTLYQASFVFDDNIIFKERRNHQIIIRHGMRDQRLKGIEKIGVRIARKE